jgi:hypothetical protein
MLEGPAHQPQVVKITTVVLNECDDSNDSVSEGLMLEEPPHQP